MSRRSRVPLSERRSQDRKGLDAIIMETGPERPAEVPVEQAARPPLAKVTLYVRPDQVMALEEIQLQQRRATGRKPDKSDLVQEALDLLIQKYSKTS
jgi:hypothetical protein